MPLLYFLRKKNRAQRLGPSELLCLTAPSTKPGITAFGRHVDYNTRRPACQSIAGIFRTCPTLILSDLSPLNSLIRV